MGKRHRQKRGDEESDIPPWRRPKRENVEKFEKVEEKPNRPKREKVEEKPDRPKREKVEEEREKFFSELPDDSFTPEEEHLRDVVLDFIDDFPSGKFATSSDVGEHEEIKKCAAALFPEGKSKGWLLEWIDRRIGGEVETLRVPGMQIYVGREGLGKAVADAKESFFASLSVDTLTPAEDELLNALLKFIDGSKSDVRLGWALKDRDVLRYRKELLPVTSAISMKDWIRARVSKHIDLVDDPTNPEISFLRLPTQDASRNREQSKEQLTTLAVRILDLRENDLRKQFDDIPGYVDGKFLQRAGIFFAKFRNRHLAEMALRDAEKAGLSVDFARRDMEVLR